MASRPPCESAAILTGPEGRADPGCGPWVLAAAILGSSMAFIDSTVVNVALPALQSSLHATLRDVQWVVEAYGLALSALLLTGGSLGDLYGRRRIFTIGVAVFAAASALCGVSAGAGELIAARALQGAGAALLVPGSLALISVAYPPAQRGRAIGTWSGFTSITMAIGPVLGGWLVQYRSWRWVFYINLPLAAAVLLLTMWRVPESRSAQARRLDLPGVLLTAAGLGGVVFGLIESSALATVAGVAALAGFLLVEAHSESAMVPLALFRSRNFSGANLITLFLYTALGGALFFFPLDLIQVQGYSATEAGAALLPLILLMFLLSRWSGGLIARFGAKRPLVFGPLVAACGFALFTRSGASYWFTFFPAILVLGLGLAVSVAPLTTTVMDSVPQDHAGVASAVNNAIARTAGVVAVALFGFILSGVFNQALDRRLSSLGPGAQEREGIYGQRAKLAAIETSDPGVRRAVQQSFLDGFALVMWIAAGLAIAGSVGAVALIEGSKPSEAPQPPFS